MTNLVLVNTDRGKGTTDVQFDLSWRNSWRASWEDTLYDGTTAVITNWDAAWVFVKFREPGGDWRHASLADDGHEAPSGIAVTVGESAGSNVGAFVYRSVTGYGELDLAKVRLRWLYTEDGAPLRTAIDLRPLRA